MNPTPANRPSDPGDDCPEQNRPAPHGPGEGEAPNPFEVLRTRLRTAFMVQGSIAAVVGLLFLIWPIDSAVVFVRVFAAWLLLSAVLSAVLAVVRRRGGLAGILLPALLGLALFLVPEAAGAVIVFVIAFLALLVGSTAVAASFGLRRAGVPGWWVGLLAGAAAAAYGFLLLLDPATGLTGLLWVLGAVLVVIGAAMLVLGWRVSRMEVRSAGFGPGYPGFGFGGPGPAGRSRGPFDPGGSGSGRGGPGRPGGTRRPGDDDDIIPGEEL